MLQVVNKKRPRFFAFSAIGALLLSASPALAISDSFPDEPSRSLHLLQRRPALVDRAVEDRGIRFTRPAYTLFESFSEEQQERRLEAIAAGIERGEQLLIQRLGLQPIEIELLFANLGTDIDGYSLEPTSRRAATIVLALDADVAELDRLVARQMALLLGQHHGLSSDWSEALALWTDLQFDRPAVANVLRAIDERLSAMQGGLNDGTAAAAWLSFVDARWGDGGIRVTLEELGRPSQEDVPHENALDRATQRIGATSFEQAYADFHLWTLFTGSRDVGKHLRFAGQLRTPEFAGRERRLPSLSIEADTPIEPFGASRVQLFHDQPLDGGLQLVFEGDLAGRWAVDLVLRSRQGVTHRLPLDLVDGRVETTIPLDGLDEAVMLVRRTDGASGALPYSYSAARERDWPVELLDLRVESTPHGTSVSWETLREQDAIGFNVFRRRLDGDVEQQLNPVWIPAVGGYERGVGYRYLDRDALPGVDYEYRIQVVTSTGMTSHSKPFRGARTP